MSNQGRTSKYEITSNSQAQSEWRVGIYLRLSREDGDKLESDSIGNQRKLIDRYLERNPELGNIEVYLDDGYTGTNFNRPGVQRLIGDIKTKKINCIIVKDLSRFGRNYHEVGNYIEVVFPLLKIRIISVNDRIDSFKDPNSLRNASVSFKNVMNDEFCRDISNKVKGSLNMKRKRGLFIGSFASYGYKKDPDNHNKLIIDPQAAENVRLIYRLFIDGTSLHNICRILGQMGIKNPTEYKLSQGLKASKGKTLESTQGAWSDRTVRRMLQNEMYLGHMIQKQMENISHKVQVCRRVEKNKQIIVRNTHEPIITVDDFNKVQSLFGRDTWQTIGDPKPVTLLSGFVKCADCGRAMQRRTIVQPYKTYHYFNCASYRKWKTCTKHKIPIEVVEKAVLETLRNYSIMALDMERTIAHINQAPIRNNALGRLRNAIASQETEKQRIKTQLNDLYPDHKNGLLSLEQYMQFKTQYENKIEEIDKRIGELNMQLNCEEDMGHSNDFIETFKKYENISQLTRQVVVELVHMIHIEENGTINISFNFQDSFEAAQEYIAANKEIAI